MHRRFGVLLALVCALVLLTASTALATSASKTTKGSLVSYAKSGTLTIKVKRAKDKFTVNHSTNCGVDYGQSGDQIKCSSLNSKKYHGKTVRVTWSKKGSKHFASLVVVQDTHK